jgi:N-acyl-D-aspartate/D-glutamate deacylase
MAYDLVVRNGWIVEGTGLPRFFGDVAVTGGRIAEVGVIDRTVPAGQVIDADGLTVAPGFIDIHTHYDPHVSWDPNLTSSCYHGVTSVVMGNCGYTLAPNRPRDRQYLLEMLKFAEGMSATALQQGVRWEWETFPQLLDTLGGAKLPLGMNVGAFIGHSSLRYHVMGPDHHRPATSDARHKR